MSAHARPSTDADANQIHLAIIHRRFLRRILDGTKTAEARLSKTRRLPYKGLEAGATIYLKPPGGQIAARAIASAVHRFEIAGPADLARIRRRFSRALCGVGPNADGETRRETDLYWASKADAAYATIIELAGVEPVEQPAWYVPQNNRSAWRLVVPPNARRGPGGSAA